MTPRPDHAARRAAVAADVADAGLDALVVSHLPNVRYLTGFTGSAGVVLVGSDGDARLVTDGRYTVQAGEEAGDLATTITRGDDWIDEAVAAGARLGLEAHAISWERARTLTERLHDREVVPADRLVEAHRAVKDGVELAALRGAAAITDAAFDDTCAWLLAPAQRAALAAGDVTERRVAGLLAERMEAHGAEGPAFPVIVAAGDHAARPHHQPTDRPLRHGDLITIDCGARAGGYCADMTRLLAVGGLDAVDAALVAAVAALAEAQAAGVAAVSHGVAACEVDAACRDRLDADGLAESFVHSTGHGVGLEVHEAPRVAATSSATLADGMVCTIEPGVYVPALGGARIEDVVAVTRDGAERLTITPRDVVAI